jgi:cold shock CspA family protein
MQQGRVIQYVESKGFGFLVDERDIRQRIFFHIRGWQHADIFPQAGMVVSFELTKNNQKGLQAVNVRLVKVIDIQATTGLSNVPEKISNPADLLALKEPKESR